MALSTSTQPVQKPVSPSANNPVPDAVLSMLLLSLYGANASKRTLRKLKRQFFLTSLKLKMKNLLQPKKRATDRTLIYIILGVALVALLIIDPVLVLALAVVVLILILAGVL